MAFKINIQSKVINFPDTSESPNWAPAVVAFAKAVEEALAVSTGAYDIAPQVLTIDDYNPGTNIDVDNLSFPPAEVIKVEITYSVYRSTSTTTVVEGGNLELVYDETRPVNQKWDVVRTTHGGDAQIQFSVTDLGQVRFSTTALGEIHMRHEGFITYRALSVLKT